MKEKKQDQQTEKIDVGNEKQKNDPRPEEYRGNNPGQDAVAKTERKGAGQQQNSGGNPVINS